MKILLPFCILWAFSGTLVGSSDNLLNLSADEAVNVLNSYSSAIQRLTAIREGFRDYWNALTSETSNPFEDVMFFSECGSAGQAPLLPLRTKGYPQRPEIPPPPLRRGLVLDPRAVSILYVILTHDHPELLSKLLFSLDEPQHTFIIHVDKKAPALQVLALSLAAASRHANVFVVDEELRQEAAWGGFSIVNATLTGMRVGHDTGRHFDFVINLSGTCHPIKSNQYIRQVLSEHSDRIYTEIRPEATFPPPEMWHKYVECDGSLHRIARMTPARGLQMFSSAQWWILPRHVSQWFLEAPLPKNYTQYARHVVVADEHYFGTMLRNSPYCGDIVLNNYHFVQFDRWEHDRNSTSRDSSKCLQPDPDHCGRSPSTLTLEFEPLLQASTALFARKFDPRNPSSLELLGKIDRMRSQIKSSMSIEDERNATLMISLAPRKSSELPPPKQFLRNTSQKWCLQLSNAPGSPIRIIVCNSSDIHQWFTLGRCTGMGAVSVRDDVCGSFIPMKNVSFEAESLTGGDLIVNPVVADERTSREESIWCQISGFRKKICLDIAGENPRPGAPLIGWDCTGRWNQLFRLHEDCRISATMPEPVGRVRGFEGKDVRLCLQTNPRVREAGHAKDHDVVVGDCEQQIVPLDGDQGYDFRFLSIPFGGRLHEELGRQGQFPF